MSDLTSDFRTSMSTFDSEAGALREIDLAAQHHGRTNDVVGMPPVVHLNTECMRSKHMFNPVEMSALTSQISFQPHRRATSCLRQSRQQRNFRITKYLYDAPPQVPVKRTLKTSSALILDHSIN